MANFYRAATHRGRSTRVPRAVHVDAELEAVASRDRLSERETPRSGFRATHPPFPRPPIFAIHRCGPQLFALFSARCSVFLDRSARDAADGVARDRHSSRHPIFAFYFPTSAICLYSLCVVLAFAFCAGAEVS